MRAHTTTAKPKPNGKAKATRSKVTAVRPRQTAPNLRVAAPPRSSSEDQYGGLLAGLIR